MLFGVYGGVIEHAHSENRSPFKAWQSTVTNLLHNHLESTWLDAGGAVCPARWKQGSDT